MLSPQAGVTLLPVSDRARQGPSCISTRVCPADVPHPDVGTLPRPERLGWRGGSRLPPRFCVRRAPTRSAGLTQPSGFWPGAGLHLAS